MIFYLIPILKSKLLLFDIAVDKITIRYCLNVLFWLDIRDKRPYILLWKLKGSNVEKTTTKFNQTYELFLVVSKLLPSSVSSKPTVTFSHLNHYLLDILFCSSFTPLLLNYTGETKADVFFSRGCKIRKDAMRKEIAGVNLPPLPPPTRPFS